MLRSLVAILMWAFSGLAGAAVWKGEAGAGLITTSGNSQTESLSGKFVLDHIQETWNNNFTATAINSGDEEGRTAERYTVGDQLNFNLDKRNYLFGAVDYEKDLFSGVRERTAETAGYGRHILVGPIHLLDVEIGAGARQTEAQDTGEKNDEIIGRFGSKYKWVISETSTFLQAVKVEYGEDNTFTESITELKLSIVGNLFASISFSVRNNSEVPADTEKTDTATTFTLAYAFSR